MNVTTIKVIIMLAVVVSYAHSEPKIPNFISELDSQLPQMLSRVKAASSAVGLEGWPQAPSTMPFAKSNKPLLSKLSSISKQVWANPYAILKKNNGQWHAILLMHTINKKSDLQLVWLKDIFGKLELRPTKWYAVETNRIGWLIPSDEVKHPTDDPDYFDAWRWYISDNAFQFSVSGYFEPSKPYYGNTLGFHPSIGPIYILNAIGYENEQVDEPSGYWILERDIPQLIPKEYSKYWIIYSYKGTRIMAERLNILYWSKALHSTFPGQIH